MLTVETWPIDRPIPYARNPRVNQDAVAVVAASLKEFGWRQPIVVDEDGVVVVGHTRLLAARQLGQTEVPVHVARGLTPAQIRAYRIADNRSGEIAEWELELLALEFADLQDAGADPTMTGFDEADVARILGAVDETSLPVLPSGERSDFEDMTFTLHRSQADTVRAGLAAAKAAGGFDEELNQNSNGNALTRLVELGHHAIG